MWVPVPRLPVTSGESTLVGPGANGGDQGIVETTTANIPRIKRTPQPRRRALAQPLPVTAPVNPKITNNAADRFSTNQKPGSSCLVLSCSIDATRNRAVAIQAEVRLRLKILTRFSNNSGCLRDAQT